MPQYTDLKGAVDEFLETGEPEAIREFMKTEFEINTREILDKNLKLAQTIDALKADLAREKHENTKVIQEFERVLAERTTLAAELEQARKERDLFLNDRRQLEIDHTLMRAARDKAESEAAALRAGRDALLKKTQEMEAARDTRNALHKAQVEALTAERGQQEYVFKEMGKGYQHLLTQNEALKGALREAQSEIRHMATVGSAGFSCSLMDRIDAALAGSPAVPEAPKTWTYCPKCGGGRVKPECSCSPPKTIAAPEAKTPERCARCAKTACSTDLGCTCSCHAQPKPEARTCGAVARTKHVCTMLKGHIDALHGTMDSGVPYRWSDVMNESPPPAPKPADVREARGDEDPELNPREIERALTAVAEHMTADLWAFRLVAMAARKGCQP